MRSMAFALFVSANLCGVLGLATPSTAHAATGELTSAASSQIDAILERALPAGPIPGVSVAIEHNGKLVYQKGFGYADLENRVKVTPETVFPIGSITKTMTGLAIAQLTSAGKVDLEETAGHYLPDLPAPARDARIRFLLEHTSGLVNYTEIPEFPAAGQQAVTRKEMVSLFAARPLLFPTGTRWSYTNSGLYILGLVIEAVSGETYTEYLQHHVFGPFGMDQTSMSGWQPLIEHRAHGYLRGPSGPVNAPRYDPLWPFAAGAVLSTSGDLIKYREGVFGEKTAAAIRSQLVRQDRLPDGFELPYTQGCLVVSNLAGHRRIGHPGEVFGFEAQYSYYPDDALTIAVLTNTGSSVVSPASLELKIARVVLGMSAPTVLDRPLTAAKAEQFAGDYVVTDMRFGFDKLGFVVRDGTLQMFFGGTGSGAPSLALRYQGGNSFVSSLDDEERLEFSTGTKNPGMTLWLYGSALHLARVKK